MNATRGGSVGDQPASSPREDKALFLRLQKTFASGFSLAVELEAPPGITILFGRSGSGKTTVLQCVAGLLDPDSGRIAIGSRILFDSEAGIHLPPERRAAGYVFQDLALFPHLTVEQNASYGLGKLEAAARHQRTRAILESFRIAHLARQKPGEISGGERQRVALARSLVIEPRVLLLDEPLSALDRPTQSQLIEDLRAWNRARRIPILYVTHSQREVFALGERVVVLEQGRVLAEGAPQETLRAPRHETVAHLAGFENIFDARVLALHEAHGTMTCRLEGSPAELEVPLAQAQAGDQARLAIYAGDILLASERPRGLSARNLLPGRLVSLRQEGITVHAQVDCGTLFRVKLTPTARESLGLEVGQQVWLVVKTYSCHWLGPGVADEV